MQKKRNTILKENYMDWDKAIQDVKEYQRLANEGEVPFLSSKEDTFTNIILLLQLGKEHELKGVNNKNGKR